MARNKPSWTKRMVLDQLADRGIDTTNKRVREQATRILQGVPETFQNEHGTIVATLREDLGLVFDYPVQFQKPVKKVKKKKWPWSR